MKKNFFRSSLIFFRALPHFMVFELLFKLILTAIGAPVLALLLKGTMKVSQLRYISDEHILVYLKNPATIAVVLIVLFFAAVFSFAELSALTACFSCYAHGGKMTAGGMIRAAYYSVKKLFRKRSFWSFLRFMAFMPLVEFTMSSGVFMMPLLPMLRTAFKPHGSAPAIAVYAALQLIMILLIVSYSYCLHYHVLTSRNFSESLKQSRRIMKGKKLNNTLWLILWTLFMLAAAALLTFIISFLIFLCLKGFSSPRKAFFSTLKVLRYAGQIFMAVSSFIATPAILCWLTGRFLADIPEDEEIVVPDVRKSSLKPLTRTIIACSLILASGALNYTYLKSIYKGNISLNVGILSRTQITAHRGFSRIAPENTMYAFEAALNSGADYIELDVQLTSDGELVVFHDQTVERTTNGVGRVSRMTYEELSQLNASGKFRDSEEYGDAKIPLFSEVLEAVGDDILLNIEIKDRGNVTETTEKTVALIKEYGVESSCYVTSFSYAALKQVKKLDPKIKTGLIANAATTAAFAQLKYIDALSMNHLLVNSTVVNNAHQNGKRIFVWTVDNSSDMQKMMALGVDNIITNRPDKAAELIYSESIGVRVLTILKAVFN